MITSRGMLKRNKTEMDHQKHCSHQPCCCSWPDVQLHCRLSLMSSQRFCPAELRECHTVQRDLQMCYAKPGAGPGLKLTVQIIVPVSAIVFTLKEPAGPTEQVPPTRRAEQVPPARRTVPSLVLARWLPMGKYQNQPHSTPVGVLGGRPPDSLLDSPLAQKFIQEEKNG